MKNQISLSRLPDCIGKTANLRRGSYAHRLTLLIVALAMMMLAPASMKGATTTMNFEDVGGSKQNYPSQTIVTMGDNYSAISGAKVGVSIAYRNTNGSDGRPNNLTMDISRVAFNFNASAGNVYDSNPGFYIRREKINNVAISGLFTGSWDNKIAILNLKIGDKVTINATASNEKINGENVATYGAGIKYIQSVHCNTNGWEDIYSNDNAWVNSNPINITSAGDLIVQVNKGTYITSIEIQTADVAEYQIRTNDDGSSEFWFTSPGVLEENDFAVPYMSFSFGSTNDYLVVQGNDDTDCAAHMIKSNGTEVLETGGTNYQPSAGSFYAFKPTANGTIYVSGEMTGRVHVFVYDPNVGTVGDWVEKQNGVFYRETFTDNYFYFSVEAGKIYYLCIDNTNDEEKNGNYAFHLHWMKFVNSFKVEKLAKVIDLTNVADGSWIELTKIEGFSEANIKTKRCSGNITPPSQQDYKIEYNYLYMKKPTFAEGTDNGGTVIIDVKTDGGDVAFVATFPYHADYNPAGYTDTNRTYGHTWNFIDPRNSDSNIGNCWIRNGDFNSFSNGEVSGILSIGQYKNTNSQFYYETQNREWTYAQRQTGEAGGFHDPMYLNVFDMVGDNADMIWETEGLWFDTGSNISCLYNESDAYDQSLTNPVDFATLGTDPDRYVGLLPVTDDKKSSFTIPGLKDGDRVLIFMKSGEGSGDNGIFLNIIGAKDAVGKKIETDDTDEDTWYRAGGTNWQHNRYEGCYHFIKDGNGDMTFDMQSGSMCKLLYIRIYTGQRIPTNNIVSSATGDSGRLLFMNDKDATEGAGSNMSLRFRGKGQQQKARVLTCSGNLNYTLTDDDTASDDHFTITGTYNQAVGYKSEVGEIGMFRMRLSDVEYSEEYVADFNDRNFTVGYRDKVDSYPYTWDFTDIQGFSSSKMSAEAANYPIAAAADDEYGDQWDISLFDADGYMKLNTGFDPESCNQIFSPHKIGNGNQLWAGGDVIPETRGLWFYSEDDEEDDFDSSYYSALYNDCMQITSDGIRFANIPDAAGKRVAWWNYKMVVPDVPADGAVYLRMKRDDVVSDDAKTWSDIDNAYVPFVATRFKFASQSAKTEVFTTTEVKDNGNYAFYQVPNTTDEWILAVKNTTGNVEHLTFTLNGWIVEKVAVSTDFKKVNKYGWATESRARVIDPSLTSEMTGYNFETYIVTGASHAAKTVTMSPISEGVYMPTASEDGKQAYIIRNMDTKEKILNANNEEIDNPEPGLVNILKQDGKFGFHLFVPDMNDYLESRSDGRTNQKQAQSVTSNLLLARLNGDLVQKDGNVYNYVLTTSTTSSGTGATIDYDNVVFARVNPNGMSGGKNVGYLPVDCSEDPTNGAKMHIIFAPWVEEPDVTDAIVVPYEEILGGSNAVYYNLNGQKIDGKPTNGGIYIVNGKKVVVK